MPPFPKYQNKKAATVIKGNFSAKQTINIFLLLLIASFHMSHADIFRVTPDGTSAEAGEFYSFQDAIVRAEKGDTIALGPGTYKLGFGITLAGTADQP